MFKEIKEMKIAELLKEIEKIKKEEEVVNQQNSENYLVAYKKLNIFHRLFRTLKFRQQQEAKDKCKNLSAKSSELMSEEIKLDSELTNLKEKQNLEEMGLTVKQSIKLLEDNNIPVVLDEKFSNNSNECREELKNKTRGKEIQSADDLVLIHKTDFIPSDNKIKTTKNSDAKLTSSVNIGGVDYSYEYPSDRETIHFSVNHEVTPNTGGDWNQCKYVVITPFKSVPKDQFAGVLSTDTFVQGDVELNKDSYILCKEEEIELVKQKNPNVNVVGYRGDTALDYANSLIVDLGYKYENGGFWNWANEKDEANFNKVIEQEGLEHLKGSHKGSQLDKEEKRGNALNRCNAIINLVKEKKILSPDNKEEIEGILGDIIKKEYKTDKINNKTIEELKNKGINLEEDMIKDINEGKTDLSDEILKSMKSRLERNEFSKSEIGKKTINAETKTKDQTELVEKKIKERESGKEKI